MPDPHATDGPLTAMIDSAIEQAMREMTIAMPVLPAPEELYDQLMGPIEPELLSSAIPGLEAKYAGESKSDAKKRAARYQAAFAAYKKRFDDYAAQMRDATRNFERLALGAAEQFSQASEQSAMSGLSSQFSL